MSVHLIQDSQQQISRYFIDASDKVFATIGGMFGFIYAIIYIFTISYQTFSFENALLKRLYTQDKEDFERVYYSAEQYQKELEEVILSRKPLVFTYWEYWSTFYLALCCCCGIRQKPWY